MHYKEDLNGIPIGVSPTLPTSLLSRQKMRQRVEKNNESEFFPLIPRLTRSLGLVKLSKHL